MIVLDTNVLSELMRASPERRALAWVNAQPASQLYTTSVSEAEIRAGIAMLPKGKRRDALAAAADAMFEVDLGGRVLPFAREAARVYALILTSRGRSGRPISAFDAQIAAICRAADARLATRNVADFDGCGLDVVDPWSARG
ncbi:MAG: type II toxin-antitoxin system VapC family toxin [Sandaracinus sp.]